MVTSFIVDPTMRPSGIRPEVKSSISCSSDQWPMPVGVMLGQSRAPRDRRRRQSGCPRECLRAGFRENGIRRSVQGFDEIAAAVPLRAAAGIVHDGAGMEEEELPEPDEQPDGEGKGKLVLRGAMVDRRQAVAD